MAHVGVERFAAGDRQDHRAQAQEASIGSAATKPMAYMRVERGEHAGCVSDVRNAEQRERQEPDQHDGPNKQADRRRCRALDQEEHGQDGHR